MTDSAERVRSHYKRMGELEERQRILQLIKAEIESYKHPYTTWENYYGLIRAVELLMEGDTNGVQS